MSVVFCFAAPEFRTVHSVTSALLQRRFLYQPDQACVHYSWFKADQSLIASEMQTSQLQSTASSFALRGSVRSLPKRWVQAKSSSGNNRGLVGMKLVGVGSCAPRTIVSNDDLAKLVDTNDEWIASRTGIKRRHILGKGETLSSLAQEASIKALEMAGLRADEVDLILYATSSPDDLFGGACQVSVVVPTLLIQTSPVRRADHVRIALR